jgi:hypothetical protein
MKAGDKSFGDKVAGEHRTGERHRASKMTDTD